MRLRADTNNTLTELPYVPPIEIPSQTGALLSGDRNKLDGLGVTYQEVPSGDSYHPKICGTSTIK
jgi:hypothetical protein